MAADPHKNSLGWLWVLMGAALLNQATIYLVRPTTTYKLSGLGAGAEVVGLVAALFALLPLVIAMPLGAAVQRTRHVKLLLIVGSGLVSGGGAIVSAAPSVVVVGLGTAVLGLGHLVFTITGQAMIARFTSDRDLDRGFGWFEAGYAVGQMAGPLLGGILIGSSGSGAGAPGDVDTALWIGTAIAVPALLLLLGLRTPSAPSAQPHSVVDAQSKQRAKPSVLRLLRTPGMPSTLLASFAVVAVLDILAAFLPLLGEAVGASPVLIGALLAVRAAATIVSRFLLPALRRAYSRNALVLASLWGSAVALVLPPLTLHLPAAAIAAMAVAGFFLGLGQPLTMSLVVQAVPPAWRSSALSLRLVANRVGQVGVPLAAGAAAAPLGPAGAIWLSCVILAAAGTERLFRR
ncbi:MFS transporter [Leucobacter sp. Psy1]|uniref:MFS transporter n=1 Tax=Leucobacter sp. Psy1 TaxID=2875729 RepID=UPI001CD40411|nr:MFS transporter [Leucobacter sp. Psy1]UBH04556.1 MFS transporter [Leucobacter sp. Psy1]